MYSSTNAHTLQKPFTPAQLAALRNGNPNRVLCRTERVPPRSDRRWRRDTERGRPKLVGSRLLEAVQWLHVRRGAAWSESDSELVAEARAQCWQAAELAGRRIHGAPTWLDELLPGRVASGCTAFVAAILASHRSGALGVMASYDELGACFRVATRTVQRWVKRLDAAGIVQVLKTYRPVPGSNRRGYGRHVYRVGPELARVAGLGILEGAAELRPRTRQRAMWHARRARERRRKRIAATRDARWLARARVRTPKRANPAPPIGSSLSLDTLTNPSRPFGLGVSTPPRAGGANGPSALGEDRPPPAAMAYVPPRDAHPLPSDRGAPAAHGDAQGLQGLQKSRPLETDKFDESVQSRVGDELGAFTAWLESEAKRRTSTPSGNARGRRCGPCGGAGVVQPGWRVCNACGGSGRVLR